jgi:glycosyltransferase involved in cell wall biosynthesis
VLHVVPSIDPSKGGPSISLLGQTEAQIAAGMNVSVVTCWADRFPEFARQYRVLGAAVEVIGPTTGRLARHPQLVATLRELVRRCDIVHTHGVWEEIIHQAVRLARQEGKPYIMRTCGMLSSLSLQQRIIHKWLFLKLRLYNDLDRAAAVHFTTRGEQDLTVPVMVIKAPAIVLPLGVRLSEFEHLPPRGTFRQKFPQLGQRPVVIFLGRVHPRKGVERLVSAMRHVNVPGAILVVAGPDADGLRGVLERQTARFGIQDRVLFTGMLTGKERVEALVDADLFALPSEYENFGVSVVEALAAGIPVLVSKRVQLYQDLLRGGVGGLISRDPKEMAVELTRWLTDGDLRRAAAAKARAFAWEHYNWTAIAHQWEGQYARLIAGNRASRQAGAGGNPGPGPA